jgi:hypothetical protein
LTKSQLLIEADAWQGLVQTKVEEIVRIEIAVKRENQEIKEAADTEEGSAEIPAEVSDQALELNKQQKVALLEEVTQLREQRTLLLDQFNFDAADIGIPFPQRDVHLYLADGRDKLSGLVAASAPAAGPRPSDGGLDD